MNNEPSRKAEPVAWMDYLEHSDVYDLNVSGRGIPLYTHPAKTQKLLDEIEDLKLQNKYLKGCKPNIEIVAENEALKAKVKWYNDTFRLPTDNYSAKTLTDEEIMKIAKECKAPWHSHAIDPMMFARAILRKAQEK